jgi:hypothetical protein
MIDASTRPLARGEPGLEKRALARVVDAGEGATVFGDGFDADPSPESITRAYHADTQDCEERPGLAGA